VTTAADKDFLLGDHSGSGKMTIQGKRPFFLAPQETVVVTRGGEYLFGPGSRRSMRSPTARADVGCPRAGVGREGTDVTHLRYRVPRVY
jgi:hypothetical protein